jgi:propanol-preferring alcohol dehydrogenase
MRAAVVSKHGEKVVVQQKDVPVPKAGEVLVRIRRSGCCHTDIHIIDGDWPVVSRLPICPGLSTKDSFIMYYYYLLVFSNR